MLTVFGFARKFIRILPCLVQLTSTGVSLYKSIHKHSLTKQTVKTSILIHNNIWFIVSKIELNRIGERAAI